MDSPATPYGGHEVWRGSVNSWECDQMGHMNVRFYVARAMEGLVGVAAALGLAGAFRADSQATLRVRDHHIRFLREARAGMPLIMRAGIVELDESEARVLQLLIHAGSGELAASFQTVVEHVTSREGRPFAWSPAVRARASRPRPSDIPAGAAPRSLTLDAPSGRASVAEAERLNLIAIASGAFTAQDCDVFGRVNAEHIIGRVADGIPTLTTDLAGGAARLEGRGGAVLEYRLAYAAWPGAGDRYEVRSGLVGFDDRAQRVAHWILDPVTGAPWATSEALAIALDLAARKIVPLTDEAKARLSERVTPGLSL